MIVIDSNILFSALVKDSTTRKIILKYNNFFLFPLFIIEEMQKHKDILLKKSGMKKQEFDTLLSIILKKVKIITEKELYPYKRQAIELVKEIDIKDAIFVACALAYNCALWSDDKKLKQIKEIKVMDTKEIIKSQAL